MPELTASDVQTFTGGRLSASDPRVPLMLSAALGVARREVGWHVSPVKTETITLDGPRSRILWLPSRKIVGITSVTEAGTLLSPNAYVQSSGDGPLRSRPMALRKTSGGSWTDVYGGVVIVLEHGFSESEAAEWRQAILSLVDQLSLMPVNAATGTTGIGLSGKRVDDVDYRYNPYVALAEETLFSIGHVLAEYRLPTVEFI